MNLTAILITAALAAVLFQRKAVAAVPNDDSEEFPLPVTEGLPEEPFTDWHLIDWLEGQSPIMDTPDENLRGFLFMIRSCEHLGSDVATGNDYGTFFGNTRFYNFADHPVITGEKQGIPLKPEWCRAAGFPSGRCVSTAAGAYQFTRPTWNELRASGPHGPRLPDFSPTSQDEAARRLLARIGALRAIEQGDITAAIRLASARWASLPGSTSGQPQKSMNFALAKFNEGKLLT